jgi:hypothetical protein
MPTAVGRDLTDKGYVWTYSGWDIKAGFLGLMHEVVRAVLVEGADQGIQAEAAQRGSGWLHIQGHLHRSFSPLPSYTELSLRRRTKCASSWENRRSGRYTRFSESRRWQSEA